MADFELEFHKVVIAEGGYVNDPKDAGGETYMGVSRRANPNWSGWKIIDSEKKVNPTTFKKTIRSNKDLTYKVKELYKKNYWDIFELDTLPNQRIAHQLFDTAVNMGPAKAVKIIQTTLNIPVTGKWSKELKDKLIKL